MDLLPETVDFLESCHVAENPEDLLPYDRIVIFTDGSSAPADRHRSAAWNDDKEAFDTWAMIVVGEVYMTTGASAFTLIGCTAQSVVVESQQPHYTGATRMGSDVAEQEALYYGPDCGGWPTTSPPPRLSLQIVNLP